MQLLLWKHPVDADGFLVLKAPQIGGQIAAFAAAGVFALGVCFILRGIVKRRLSTKCAYPAVDVPYYDVDSLDYGFRTGGAAGGGVAGGGPRLYPERWLMLFIYSLNMATLSVLASTLPSSQLPAEHLYGVSAYPIVTLMSVLVFLSLPATIASSILFKRFGGYAAGFFTGGSGFVQLIWDSNRQAIQDKTAHTVVIDLRQPRRPVGSAPAGVAVTVVDKAADPPP